MTKSADYLWTDLQYPQQFLEPLKGQLQHQCCCWTFHSMRSTKGRPDNRQAVMAQRRETAIGFATHPVIENIWYWVLIEEFNLMKILWWWFMWMRLEALLRRYGGSWEGAKLLAGRLEERMVRHGASSQRSCQYNLKLRIEEYLRYPTVWNGQGNTFLTEQKSRDLCTVPSGHITAHNSKSLVKQP